MTKLLITIRTRNIRVQKEDSMKKFNQTLEKYLVPIGTYLSGNKYLQILRRAMLAIMPLTIAGSVVLIINSFPFIDNVIPLSIMTEVRSFLGIISSVSLSLVGFYLVGVVSYYYAKAEETEPLFAMIVGMSSFLILTPLTLRVEGIENLITSIIPMSWLGGRGLFTALITGFVSISIFNYFLKKNITIKLPDSVPPMVSAPFRILVPAFITFLVFAGIRYFFTFTSYGDVHTFFFDVLQTPLMKLGSSLPAMIIIVIFIQSMWFMGLHGQSIAKAVILPVWEAATFANLAATQAGLKPEYIFTTQFHDVFIPIQFTALIIACLLVAKSSQLKSVSKLSIGSACFNISEPIVFGAPVVLNVMLLIPWILTMIVFVLITWGFMASGLCPYPTGAVIPWTTPPFISGYLATGSIMGVVVQIINFVVGTLIYIPFVKMYDNQLLNEEKTVVGE